LTVALGIASPGDTIIVRSGTYREGNVSITKPITIIGDGLPVFDGEKKYEIFTIKSHNVTVEGLKFSNTGTASMNDIAAISVSDAKHVTIRGNQFSDTFFGIHFSNTSHSLVENNHLRATAVAEYEI